MTTVPFRSRESAMTALQRIVEDEQAPMTAMLELADRCNEVCVHCYQEQGQKGELPTDDWRRALDELAAMGVFIVTLSGGEVTLRKDFLDIVAHARKRKFMVKVYTNGLRIDAAMADALASHAVQEVQISLYSPRAEVHDWVTGVPGSFDKVVRAVKLLRARGVGVAIKTVLTSFNFDDRQRYYALAERLGVDYMMSPDLTPREDGDDAPRSFGLTKEQLFEVARDPKLIQGRKRRPKPRDATALPCRACRTVHIEPNGEVRPCTQLNVAVGHVRDGVASAYESDVARSIRSMTWGALPGCRQCDLNGYCNRCFGTARKEAGDALAPYPSACERARLHYERIEGVAPRVAGDPTVGPYRRTADHEFEVAAYEPRDDPSTAWARTDGPKTPAASPPPHSPGQLVQIRRPGSKEPRSETVPPRAEPG
jgi:AdoMet-dependent heme synthase